MSRKKVYGVGIYDVPYSSQKYEKQPNGKYKLVWRCPIYDKWTGMLSRAYCEKSKKDQRHYDGVTVCSEWHYFSKFKEWMESQYYEEDWHLDKDILVPGNKVYCKERCRFVPREINSILVNAEQKTDCYYPGVTYNQSINKFTSRMSVGGRRVYLGAFNMEIDAFLCYKYWKESYVKSVAEKWKGLICKDVYNSLMTWEIRVLHWD